MLTGKIPEAWETVMMDKNVFIAASPYFTVTVQCILQHDRKVMSHDKN